MHKDECDRSDGQRCSKENVELCEDGHEDYGYKRGNGAGPMLLEGILLAWMPNIPC